MSLPLIYAGGSSVFSVSSSLVVTTNLNNNQTHEIYWESRCPKIIKKPLIEFISSTFASWLEEDFIFDHLLGRWLFSWALIIVQRKARYEDINTIMPLITVKTHRKTVGASSSGMKLINKMKLKYKIHVRTKTSQHALITLQSKAIYNNIIKIQLKPSLNGKDIRQHLS